MSLRRNRFCACFCVLLSAVGLAAGRGLATEPPQVLQPNGSAYNEGEVAILSEAIGILHVTLAAPTYASQKTFGLGGWGKWTSAEFAAYTAGILAGNGYLTRLVSAAGWADGVHTWVLVGLSVGERTAWVPVEASPEMGAKQIVLGRLP
ncbi:MAG: hypothetical protein PHW86_06560, partial [Candidatus Bipolaricaulis sp.]|nr:hypothetical protein [Candidatus Bipolaricaulis sp.]